MTRVLRIDHEGKRLSVRALVPERFSHYGFGTFLEQVEPGEISISRSALDALLACPYRSGLQGMEVFTGNILAWGAPHPSLKIGLEDVSLHPGAEEWLRVCTVVEDSLAT